MSKNKLTTTVAKAGVTAALYVVLFLPSINNTAPIQFRPSEMLTILPAFMPETIIGCYLGCLLANIIGGFTVYDIVLGSCTTLLAAVLSYLFGSKIKNFGLKCAVSGFFPVLLNALFMPLIWMITSPLEYIYILSFVFMFVSQSISIYILGVPSAYALKRLKMTNCSQSSTTKIKEDTDKENN